MTDKQEKSRVISTRLWTATWALAIVASVFCTAPAIASHSMGGTFSWVPRPDISPFAVEFKIIAVHRRAAPGYFDTYRGAIEGQTLVGGTAPDGLPQVGDVYQDLEQKSLKTGDPRQRPVGVNTCPSSIIRWKAIAVDVAQNWVVSEMRVLVPGGTTTAPFVQTYGSSRNGTQPFNPVTDNWCCRPVYDGGHSASGELGTNHKYNDLQKYVMSSGIDLTTSNRSPVCSVFPPGIIKVPQIGIQKFFVPATDPDGDVLTWSLVSTNFTAHYIQPPGVSIDAGTGQISWNTALACNGGVYSCAVIISDGKTSITADFEMMAVGTLNPVAFAAPLNGGQETLTIPVGGFVNVSLPVAATDSRNCMPGNLLTLSASGLPAGATFTSTTDYGSASGTMTWAPTEADAGDHVITFEAVDMAGGIADKHAPLSTSTYTYHINRNPSCSGVTASLANNHPPNHALIPVTFSGAADPDGDPVTLTVTDVRQDELANRTGDGDYCPDAVLSPPQIRWERVGGGNGRVYTLYFTLSDGRGGSCNGTSTICVPATGDLLVCTNDGPNFSSFACPSLTPESSMSAALPASIKLVRSAGASTMLEYTLPAEVDVQLGVYDIAGRQLASLTNSRQSAGVHTVDWNTSGLANGIYFYRLRAGNELVTKSVLHVR